MVVVTLGSHCLSCFPEFEFAVIFSLNTHGTSSLCLDQKRNHCYGNNFGINFSKIQSPEEREGVSLSLSLISHKALDGVILVTYNKCYLDSDSKQKNVKQY